MERKHKIAKNLNTQVKYKYIKCINCAYISIAGYSKFLKQNFNFYNKMRAVQIVMNKNLVLSQNKQTGTQPSINLVLASVSKQLDICKLNQI